jgi:hypothetical protein
VLMARSAILIRSSVQAFLSDLHGADPRRAIASS